MLSAYFTEALLPPADAITLESYADGARRLSDRSYPVEQKNGIWVGNIMIYSITSITR